MKVTNTFAFVQSTYVASIWHTPYYCIWQNIQGGKFLQFIIYVPLLCALQVLHVQFVDSMAEEFQTFFTTYNNGLLFRQNLQINWHLAGFHKVAITFLLASSMAALILVGPDLFWRVCAKIALKRLWPRQTRQHYLSVD